MMVGRYMNTYDALHDHLAKQTGAEVTLTFDEIARLIGQPLPASAQKYQAFWANEDPLKTRHYHCKAWRTAGYKAKPNFGAESVTFYRD